MKCFVKRLISSAVVLAILVSVAMYPCPVGAFDNSSTYKLPHEGAFWKAWRQNGGDWYNFELGNGENTTIARIGCVITSISAGAKSYCARLDGEIFDTVTPYTVAYKGKSVGAFTPGGAYDWNKTSEIFEALTYMGKESGLTTVSAITNKVEELLDDSANEHMVLVCFDGDHYVLADHIEDGVLYVYDPAPGSVSTLQAALNRGNYSLSGYFYFKYTGVMRGDGNQDGTVNTADAMLVLQFASGDLLAVDNMTVVDFNDDGKVNTADARLILRHASGL